jgi:phosphoglycolate phosphatase-like HAD superfamily hydrolase
MKLVMFDIDGTLTDTQAADADAFVEAVQETLGIAEVDTDWASYPHVTSEGVLDEIVRRALGRPVAPAESQTVQRRFVGMLARKTLREIPGAAVFLRRLAAAGYAVSLASGDWELSARHKLAVASIPADGLPVAFCDSATARADIMRLSLRRALRHHQCDGFEQIVYVGDGSWDVRASRELGWGFVGIENGNPPSRLRALGAERVFPDFRQADAILLALAAARPPQ